MIQGLLLAPQFRALNLLDASFDPLWRISVEHAAAGWSEIDALFEMMKVNRAKLRIGDRDACVGSCIGRRIGGLTAMPRLPNV